MLNQKSKEELFPIFRHAWEAILVLLVLYFLVMFIPAGLVYLIPLEELTNPELITFSIRFVFLSLYFFVLWPKFRYPKNYSQISEYLEKILLKKPNHSWELRLGLMTAGITLCCSFIAVLLTGAFILDFSTILPPTSWYILTSLIPGIFEEICFRGILLSIFLKTPRGNPKNAIIASSIIFGLFHFTNLLTALSVYTIIQAIISIFGGIMFAYLTIKTNSIFPAMISHYLIDVFAPLVFNAPEANLILYGGLLVIIGFLLSTILNIKIIDYFINKRDQNSSINTHFETSDEKSGI
ncbi:hypothetical protein NEF87_001690 [Candidatus Lokiarchaeum ossiferum]|uniref:CAAX prenyl protease 2/Lysostaphin resistance protein A-like domain-containing protein n=1 Tax=Candidatus Lokiarchaeum ossiferum TaxID=2951803 RepID=A0ABY6HPF5_9ARCH|nr:hypothetical protein NEF87_001690 [Candidatus Lokiarchaeum sp. B-35]